MNAQVQTVRVFNLQQAAGFLRKSNVANDGCFVSMIRTAIAVGAVTVEKILENFEIDPIDWENSKNLPSQEDRKIIKEWVVDHTDIAIRAAIQAAI